MEIKYAIQFIGYCPRIYSGFDKYNLSLSEELKKSGITSVFVFHETLEYTPELKNDLEKSGTIIEIIPSLSIGELIKSIIKMYVKYNPIIVHTHFENKIKLITSIISKIRGVKHFTSFHSMISQSSYSDYKKRKGSLRTFTLSLFYKILIFNSNRIIFISDAIKEQFIKFSGSSSPKIITLYLGVPVTHRDNDKMSIREKLNLPQDKIIFANVSAIEYIKGIDLSLKAISKIVYEYGYNEFIFCHIGGIRCDSKENRDYHDSLIEMVASLKLEDNVKWLGYRGDIINILPAFDFYIHPSRTEGIPVSIMEAALNSLPIVATKVGGIPEIVSNNSNGYLIEMDNIDELAIHVLKLIKSKDTRLEMGSKSYEIVSKLFNQSIQVKKLINFYLTN